MSAGLSWSLASLAMADLVAAHEFGLRERLALDLVRKQSLGAGRTHAHIPSWRYFAAAMRVSRGNASATVNGLQRKRVIEEEPKGVYRFALPVAQWLVPVRTTEIEVIRQLELLEWPALVRAALLELFVEEQGKAPQGGAPVRESHAASGGTELHAALARGGFEAQPGVPESGTPGIAGPLFPNREQGPEPNVGAGPVEYSRIGNSSQDLQDLQPCSLALKQACKVASLQSVPESGTAAGARLSAEQQEIFDALREAGALGPGEASRGNWLDFVRRRPAMARELLGELKYARHSRRIINPGGWMMDKWIRWGRPDK